MGSANFSIKKIFALIEQKTMPIMLIVGNTNVLVIVSHGTNPTSSSNSFRVRFGIEEKFSLTNLFCILIILFVNYLREFFLRNLFLILEFRVFLFISFFLPSHFYILSSLLPYLRFFSHKTKYLSLNLKIILDNVNQ